VAYAFGHIEDARALQPLIEALKDDDEDVRRAAAYALGHLRDARAVQPLIEALKDDDEDVRRAVDQALRNLGSEPPPPDHKRRIA
jgi:HEAT repeat protein